uniref:Uncharacterized protein n=1 Tax=Plectus sambesii TaxID=2011161 RepID=A0A914W3R6_9BILA
MMRIHELIQRKKIIQSLNENYVTMQQLDKQEKFDLQQAQGIQQKLDEAKKKRSVRILPHTPDGNNHMALCPCSSTSPVTSPTSKTFETPADREARESIRILVRELSFKLNDLQKRALRVTWKRLTDAPRT